MVSDNRDQQGDASNQLLAEAQKKIADLKHKHTLAEASKLELAQRLAEVEAALETVSETARLTESAQVSERLVVGGWRLVVGGWWLAVGGWWLVVGVLVVGGWCVHRQGYRRLLHTLLNHVLQRIRVSLPPDKYLQSTSYL